MSKSPAHVLADLRGHAVYGEVRRGRGGAGLQLELGRLGRASVNTVSVSLEMIASAKTLATLLTLIWPLTSVCPQVFSIILLGEKLLSALLAPLEKVFL